MQYLMEVARIVEGAVRGDKAKVVGYAEQLLRKLTVAGDLIAVDRLKGVLGEPRPQELSPSALMPSRLPVDTESRLALADESRPQPGQVPLVMGPAVRNRVEEFLSYVQASEKLLAAKVGVAPSMIISGPPGVGKTQLATYMAAQLALPLLTARTDSLISSFLGSTSKNMRILFEHARSRPCVLFLDELDAIGKLRDDQHELGELKRVVVSLLQNIDALGNEVVLLGATNHPHLLDPALWRRFAYRMEIDLPGDVERLEMFEMFLKAYPSLEPLSPITELSSGLSGADIQRVCDRAIRDAVISDSKNVQLIAIIRSLVRARLGEKVLLSPDDPMLVKKVHDLSPQLFTLKWLAATLNSSEPTIYRRLLEARETNGRRTKASDKGSDSTGRRPNNSATRPRKAEGVR